MRGRLVVGGIVCVVALGCGSAEKEKGGQQTASCRALAACCTVGSEGLLSTCNAAVMGDSDETCSLLLEHVLETDGCGSGGNASAGSSGGGGSGAGAGGTPSATGLCDNVARTSRVSSETTYGGYSPMRTIDGDRDTSLGGSSSWANDWSPPEIALPQWFEMRFLEPRSVARVEIYTTDSYRIQEYDLLAHDGVDWQPVLAIQGNTAVHRTHEFPLTTTEALRILVRRGPEHQFIHARLNEVEVYAGTAVECD